MHSYAELGLNRLIIALDKAQFILSTKPSNYDSKTIFMDNLQQIADALQKGLL